MPTAIVLSREVDNDNPLASAGHIALQMISPVRFIPAHRVEPTVLNGRINRHVVHLIKIDDQATSEIWLLPKRHVHKTESTVNGWKMRVGSREAIYES